VLAQKVFEQGHYAGRTQPTGTRQGTYATAPSGVMLASINSNDPQAMADMLRRALAKWSSLSEQERMLGTDPARQKTEVRRYENRYPTDGLVLRVFSRDLPRAVKPTDWRADAWNQDYVWFKKEEARSLLPLRIAVGERGLAPDALSRRLARLNFVDHVRGQTMAYEDKHVHTARLETEVLSVTDGIATLKVTGETKAEREGVWAVAGFRDMNTPQPQKIGMSLKLYGTAKYNIAQSKFITWEVLALGARFGATQYNGRHGDLEPAPIGFFLVQGGATAAEKVAPSFIWAYGQGW
jgi:hypothetical protein